LREIKSKPVILFGVVLFCIVVLFSGYLTPDYSHFRQAISELGAPNAPYGWFVRWLGFIPLGISFIVFAFQFRKTFSNNLPLILFLLTGIAIIVAGIFPTDPQGRRDTLSAVIHAIAGISLLSLLSLTPLFLALSPLYRTPPKRWLLIFSFLMGTLVLTFFVMLPNGISPQLVALHQKILAGYFEIWYPLHGLHQRLLLILYFIWLLTFSHFVTKSDPSR